jgi:hypothetical protein
MSIGARIKRAIGPGAVVGLKMGLIFGYLLQMGGCLFWDAWIPPTQLAVNQSVA